MGRTIDDVVKNWDKSMFGIYVNRDIKYSPEMDNDFVRGNFSYGGYCEGTAARAVTSDIDDTATKGRTLSSLLIDGLSSVNRLIKRISNKLHNDNDSLPNLKNHEEVRDVLRSFHADLARCEMHQSEFMQAAEYAAGKVALVDEYYELVSASDEMGYIFNFLTGAPLECGLYLVQERLKIPTAYVGISRSIKEKVFGSIFKFDPYTKRFTGEVISGVEEKPKRMNEIHRDTGCSDDLSIFISDDQVADGKAASMAGFAIWVDVKGIFRKIGLSTGIYNLPGKHSIYCPEARHSMKPVIKLIKMFNRFKTAEYLMTPESELMLYNLAVELKESYKKAVRAKENFFFHKDNFLRCSSQIVSIVDPIVTERSLNLSNYARELHLSTDMERDKSLMKGIISRFSERLPEVKAPKSFGAALREIVKEKQLFKPEEWWFRCLEA
ncbi:MAG: hypothetical protein A2Y81_03440 [Nitrospirae bacterium RBG_13_43_8]|nr:MAG: hypothetical protein A2Y81_03440 [Nitrospirae bacterium RBG_13_43_8]